MTYDDWRLRVPKEYDGPPIDEIDNGPDPDELRDRWIDRKIDEADQERARKKDEK